MNEQRTHTANGCFEYRQSRRIAIRRFGGRPLGADYSSRAPTVNPSWAS